MFGRLFARYSSKIVRCGGGALDLAYPTTVLRRPLVQHSVPLINYVRDCHHSVGVQVQHPAPPFKGTAVVNGDFKDIDLSDFKGKYLVLFFYPLDFTFVCPTEIIAFSDRIDEFKAIDTAVVGVSCDSHFSHLAWINTPRKHGGLGELKYPLLADFNKTIARDYNVLLEADGVPLRGLFIIDPKGVVRQITVNDLPVGRSVDEVIRLVKAFQFTDKHGEEELVSSSGEVVDKNLKTTFSIANIKPSSSYPSQLKFPSHEETGETKNLNVTELERIVLLDQLKFYRMQIEDLQSRREELKKQEARAASILLERDCIAV